jgi:glycerophosphoryl diester phosphodiesterase
MALGAMAWTLILLGPATAQDLVAHRGASYDAPENTLAAFRLAWEQGADAIEGDFMLTRDGKIVCHHDKTLRRTAGDPRAVAEVTLAEIRSMEVGSWKDARFAGEPIPTLVEVLAVMPEGKRLFLEIKCGPEIVEPLREVLMASALPSDQIEIISFDETVIAQCRHELPAFRAHWLTSYKRGESNAWEPSKAEVLEILQEVKASGLDTRADPDVVTTAFVAKLREAGLAFHCWTVNTPALARHFRALEVDSITTDRPAWLRRQLDGVSEESGAGR